MVIRPRIGEWRLRIGERDPGQGKVQQDPSRKLLVTLETDESGMIVAECPAIPGCVSQGRTEAEALDNIREAIAGCLATRAANGMPATFEALPEDDKLVFTVEFLRRAVLFDSGALDDSETAAAADHLLSNLE